MFTLGFDKTAGVKEHMAQHGKKYLAGAGLAALIGGEGAMIGHQAHIGKKLIHARQGKDYKEKSFIDKHPKTTGALTLGLAPAISLGAHQMRLDRENPKVRKVYSEHPLMLGHQ
jgi:hypothetical protein